MRNNSLTPKQHVIITQKNNYIPKHAYMNTKKKLLIEIKIREIIYKSKKLKTKPRIKNKIK